MVQQVQKLIPTVASKDTTAFLVCTAPIDPWKWVEDLLPYPGSPVTDWSPFQDWLNETCVPLSEGPFTVAVPAQFVGQVKKARLLDCMSLTTA